MRTHRFRRPINLVLTLALLLASTLGLGHGILHASGLQHFAPPLVQQAMHDAAQPDGPAVASNEAGSAPLHGWLLKLFDHHEGEQCRLYDQLHASCTPLGVPVLAIAAVLPQSVPHYFLRQAAAWRPALFNARGPPSNH